MAPSKKKKKSATNPARGFATTSIPTKAKYDETQVYDNDIESPAISDPTGTDSNQKPNTFNVPSTTEGKKDLSELSSQDLEHHFEESELQLLLESHGEKCGKNASRQINKLKTEQRVLRPQSELLNVNLWLSDELVDIILDMLKSQLGTTNHNKESGSRQSEPQLSEEDLVIRIWTLERILGGLGFTKASIRQATCSLFGESQFSQVSGVAVGKDFNDDLDRYFDILILNCDSDSIPNYNFQRNDVRRQKNRTVPFTNTSLGFDQVEFKPKMQELQTFSELVDEETTTADKSSMTQNMIVSDSESELSDASEPGYLTRRYLSLQSRIFQLKLENAKLKVGDPTKQKTKLCDQKSKQCAPEITRLLKKIDKLESDILFDRDVARIKWIEKRDQLAKESTERKKFQLDDDLYNESSVIRTSLPRQNISDETGEDGESEELLGDLFSTLPEVASNSDTESINMVSKSAEGQMVTIRSFGSWSGVHPRRIFEEACKARDPACRITYNVISDSFFSKRCSLLVEWSRTQDLPCIINDSPILYHATEERAIFQMITVSTPEAAQSEAYISTIALFLIFATSAKEEKVYFRLPQIWRDLWMQMSTLKQEQTDAANRDHLRELQELVAKMYSKGVSPVLPHDSAVIRTRSEKQISAQSIDPKKKISNITREDTAKLWQSKASTPAYHMMLPGRMKLPVWKFKDRLLQAIQTHQVVIVCGATGCGKSTQVPAYILEHEMSRGCHCKIYCTEPRRISAISLARRVSEELGEQKKDIGTSRSFVGYAIRLESQITAQTRLVYATTGIVMRMLEHSDDLGDITHLVLDEVHERSIDSDFLLIVLRKLMPRRPTLKVILMSATVDASRFSSYLAGAPILDIPGRTFPVETKYLEDVIEATNFYDRDLLIDNSQGSEYIDDEDVLADEAKKSGTESLGDYSVKTRKTLAVLDESRIGYSLILRLLELLATSDVYTSCSKAILIFLPGMAEIRQLNNLILNHPCFSQDWYICSLHSSISSEEQERAFVLPPPGTRKIVLSTNIAETGITIPDVTCVIDSGKHREMRYDERRQLSRLIETFISRANAKQRRGRAGRVQKGICFHLFTKARHDNLMLEEQIPEMLRLSLQDLVLRVKICQLGAITETLSEALDPPSSKNIQRAVDSLVDVKALTTREELTPLGRQLAKLPLDVFLGKLLLLGTIFQCLDETLSIAAILSSKSPFSAPTELRSQADIARLAFRKGDSDLLTIYNAYCAWRQVCNTAGGSEHQFCRRNYLSSQTLSNIEDLKAQLVHPLIEAGFVALNETERMSLNRVRFHSSKRLFVQFPDIYKVNSGNERVVNSVIAWSFFPKLLKRDGKGWRNVTNSQSVSLHPTSVNKGMENPPRWLSYYHIMQSSNKFYNAHETSAVESLAIILACGDAEFKMYAGVIVIDGNRIRFAVDSWKIMLAIKTLRTQIRQIMFQAFRRPEQQFSPQQRAWLEIWQKIFTQEIKPK